MSFAAAAFWVYVVILGSALLGLVVVIVRHERDAWLGRRLIEAAGSEDLAKLAIAEARAERLVREKALEKATDDVFGRGFRTAEALRLVKR